MKKYKLLDEAGEFIGFVKTNKDEIIFAIEDFRGENDFIFIEPEVTANGDFVIRGRIAEKKFREMIIETEHGKLSFYLCLDDVIHKICRF